MTEKIAGYARVSTSEQNLDRQLSSIRDYAERKFGSGLGDLEIYRDKSTGTDTDRSGYREMMADAESGEFSTVVVHSISRVSRSISDLDRTARRLENCDVALHIVSEGLQIEPDESDPFQRALFQLLGVFAEFEAEMARARTREGIAARQESEDYHHGRAPLGFQKDEGALVEADNYHDVAARLEMIRKGELSKRQAAQELDTSRKSIDRALERGEMYGVGSDSGNSGASDGDAE